MRSRGVRDRSPPELLARKTDESVGAIRREGRREQPRRARRSARRPKALADGSDDLAGIREQSG